MASAEQGEALGQVARVKPHGAAALAKLHELVTDEGERARLSQLTEWELEQELTQRHSSLLRKRQREELLGRSEETSDSELPSGAARTGTRRSVKKTLRGRLGGEKLSAANLRRQSSAREESESEDEEEGSSATAATSESSAAEDETSDGDDSSSADKRRPSARHRSQRSTTIESTTTTTRGRRRQDFSVREGDEFGGGSESDFDKLRRRKHSNEVPLFVDDKFDLTNEKTGLQGTKLLKILNDLTRERLEAARLTFKNLVYILEHPRAESYITGALVRLPYGGAQRSSLGASGRVAYVGRIVSLQSPDGSTASGAHLPSSLHTVRLAIEGCPYADNQTEIVSVSDVMQEPFKAEEVDAFKETITTSTTIRLASLPKEIAKKAKLLKEFAFTDQDVDILLKQKQAAFAASGGTASNLGGADSGRTSREASLLPPAVSGNFKQLFHRKTEIEVEVERLKIGLQTTGIDSGTRQSKASKLKSLEREMQSIQQVLIEMKSAQATSQNSFHGVVRIASKPAGLADANHSKTIPTAPRGFGGRPRVSVIEGPSVRRGLLAPGGAKSMNDPYVRRGTRPTSMWATSSEKPIASTPKDKPNPSAPPGTAVGSGFRNDGLSAAYGTKFGPVGELAQSRGQDDLVKAPRHVQTKCLKELISACATVDLRPATDAGRSLVKPRNPPLACPPRGRVLAAAKIRSGLDASPRAGTAGECGGKRISLGSYRRMFQEAQARAGLSLLVPGNGG